MAATAAAAAAAVFLYFYFLFFIFVITVEDDEEEESKDAQKRATVFPRVALLVASVAFVFITFRFIHLFHALSLSLHHAPFIPLSFMLPSFISDLAI